MIIFPIIFILLFFGSCFSVIHRMNLSDLTKLFIELLLAVVSVIIFVNLLEKICK